jgi:hypothetical protein
MVLMGARGLPLRLFAQKSQSDIPYSESQRLIASVLSLERNLTAQSPAVQEWLANSEIVRRTKATGLHESFNDNLAFKSRAPLVYPTRFTLEGKRGNAGIDQRPWLSVAKYSPSTELNSAEMETLPNAALKLAQGVTVVDGAELLPIQFPFPLGMRERPTAADQSAFNDAIGGSKLPKRDRELMYQRRFAIGVTKDSLPARNAGCDGFGYLDKGSDELFMAYRLRVYQVIPDRLGQVQEENTNTIWVFLNAQP